MFSKQADKQALQVSEPFVLILGVERSGSTWLSNIFDASPATLFFMEPFAEAMRIFDGFPSRLRYIRGADSFLEHVVTEGIGDLYAHKYQLWDRHDADYAERFISYNMMKARAMMARVMRVGEHLSSRRYRELSINRWENKDLTFSKKNKVTYINTFKELRLNLKVPLIGGILSDAVFVVVIRNPVSQIGSIVEYMMRGSLYELRCAMYEIIDSVVGEVRFNKYWSIMERVDRKSILERAILYWFINYNTLIEDLDSAGYAYKVVYYEDLCEDAIGVASDTLAFAGVDAGDEVLRYISRSSSTRTSSSSPLNTTRRSKSYYKEAFHKSAEAFLDDFLRVSNGLWEISPQPVRRYRTALEQEDDRRGR